MSSFGATIRKRLNKLRELGEDVPKIVDEVNTEAAIEAVRVATENTPPNAGRLMGTGTRTGQMAEHWTLDSETDSKNGVAFLRNNMQYASYVNDGHRMDEHFVPGLTVNNGMVERIHAEDGGIMVGVRTKYVRGYYMKEKAIGKWRTVVRHELDKRIKEHFEQ